MREFGPFSLDAATGELRRHGSRVRLPPQPTQALVRLTEEPGRLLTREELCQSIWGAETHVRFEQSLNYVISQIRTVLRDSAEDPKYIETVPKRGYRFVATVRVAMPEAPAGSDAVQVAIEGDPASLAHMAEDGPSSALDGSHASRKDVRSRALVMVLFAAVVLTAAGVWIVHAVTMRTARQAVHPVVAVLPMVNLTGDASRAYVCDGITEEIIADLTAASGDQLGVIARTSAMSYRNTTMTVKQIGADLNSQYVLEGSLQGQGDHVHLIAQLIRVSDQTHLWAKTYDGSSAELYSFVNDISNQVALSLLSNHDVGHHQEHGISAEAHNFYLKGLYGLALRSRTGFEEALTDFSKAVQLEPRYARAYAELAVSYNLMGQYNWMRQEEAKSQGRAAALQALAIDPSQAEARAALGFSDWFYSWDSISGQRELERAVASEPNNVDAHHWLGLLLATRGRLDEAERQMNMAIALDPDSPILRTNLGWIHYMGRKYDLARKEIEAVALHDPKFLTAHVKLWWLYSVTGDEANAWKHFQVLLQFITTPEILRAVQHTYNSGAGYPAALMTFETAASSDALSYSNQPDKARLLCFAGDRAGAIQALEEGLRIHDGWMVFVQMDPAFETLRNDPAFRNVVSQVQSGL